MISNDDALRFWPHAGETFLVTKGAPEAVLSRAVAIEVDGLGHPLDESWRNRLDEQQQRLNAQGFRLLGVATRSAPTDQPGLTLADESDLTFVGFCVFADPPKARCGGSRGRSATAWGGPEDYFRRSARPSFSMCGGRWLGHQTRSDRCRHRRLTDAALAVQVQQVQSVRACRSRPEEARRRGPARHGHIVGFLGDGINDAPAHSRRAMSAFRSKAPPTLRARRPT